MQAVAAAIKISCQSDFAKWMVKQKGRAPRRAPNSLKRLTSHLLWNLLKFFSAKKSDFFSTLLYVKTNFFFRWIRHMFSVTVVIFISLEHFFTSNWFLAWNCQNDFWTYITELNYLQSRGDNNIHTPDTSKVWMCAVRIAKCNNQEFE